MQSAGADLEASLGDPGQFNRAYESFTKLKHGELVLVTSSSVLAAATYLWWCARGLKDRQGISSVGDEAIELQRRLFKLDEACREDVRASFQILPNPRESKEVHRLLTGELTGEEEQYQGLGQYK